ncbi:MAG TPA: hypothetical protein DDZ96_13150 [Porphyromonadaceae bacterium]|jgi:hypothetical protein|nr:hypothetical protein [Porphyromonadaceae bacterium]HCM21630.1 hypothetical protein [Porphyromonadaceae bacterium]
MKKELQRIANTLVLYSYHANCNGLLDGKMGIILFLYRYADYSGCKYYREFSDKLLDKVLASITHVSSDFENGLAGIGWVVNYLIKRGLIDGAPNEVLQDVDKNVFSNYRCNPSVSLFGQGIYLIERLKDNPSNTDFEKHVVECLDFCHKGMKEYNGPVSLYHINSLLFFLLKIEVFLSEEVKIDSIKKLLFERLNIAFRDKIYDDVDLYIFKRLLDGIESKQKNKWQDILLLKTPELLKHYEIERRIKISWQEALYFRNSQLGKIPSENIGPFIDCKQESLTMKDFLFAGGLAGFGNMILSDCTTE